MNERKVFDQIVEILTDSEEPDTDLGLFLTESRLSAIPILSDCWSSPQSMKYHRNRTVGEHTLLTIHYAGKTLLMRLAGLFHDTGKRNDRRNDSDGLIRYSDHARVGAKLVHKFLNQMEFDEKLTKDICWLVKHHDIATWRNLKTVEKVDIINHPLFTSLVGLRFADVMAQNQQIERVSTWLHEIHEMDHKIVFYGKKPFNFLDDSDNNESIVDILVNRVGITDQEKIDGIIEDMRVRFISGEYGSRVDGYRRLKKLVVIPEVEPGVSAGAYLHRENVPNELRSKIIDIVKSGLWTDREGYAGELKKNIDGAIIFMKEGEEV